MTGERGQRCGRQVCILRFIQPRSSQRTRRCRFRVADPACCGEDGKISACFAEGQAQVRQLDEGMRRRTQGGNVVPPAMRSGPYMALRLSSSGGIVICKHFLLAISDKARCGMQVEVASVSTKGQIVIPRTIRKSLGITSGSKLVVMTDGENVLMKPIQPPRIDPFEDLLKESREAAAEADLTPQDVQNAVREVRRARRS